MTLSVPPGDGSNLPTLAGSCNGRQNFKPEVVWARFGFKPGSGRALHQAGADITCGERQVAGVSYERVP